MGQMKTYNPKEVTIVFGNHIVTGVAEDSFVTIEQNSDGITKKIGCDGEIVRSISPDDTYNIQINLLYGSATSAYLQGMASKDIKDGKGTFAVLIKDLKGGTVFSANDAWVVKSAGRQYGRESQGTQWNIQTGSGKITE